MEKAQWAKGMEEVEDKVMDEVMAKEEEKEMIKVFLTLIKAKVHLEVMEEEEEEEEVIIQETMKEVKTNPWSNVILMASMATTLMNVIAKIKKSSTLLKAKKMSMKRIASIILTMVLATT